MNETYKYFRLDISESFLLDRWEMLFLWKSLSGQKRNIQYFAFYSKSAFALYIYTVIIIIIIIIIIDFYFRFKDKIEPSMFWEKSGKTILIWNVIQFGRRRNLTPWRSEKFRLPGENRWTHDTASYSSDILTTELQEALWRAGLKNHFNYTPAISGVYKWATWSPDPSCWNVE